MDDKYDKYKRKYMKEKKLRQLDNMRNELYIEYYDAIVNNTDTSHIKYEIENLKKIKRMNID